MVGGAVLEGKPVGEHRRVEILPDVIGEGNEHVFWTVPSDFAAIRIAPAV